jgi:hypothetical protein
LLSASAKETITPAAPCIPALKPLSVLIARHGHR